MAADQDLLWKITLPTSERLNALLTLEKLTIDAYSLFESEESLMESVAARAFIVRPYQQNN